MRHSNQKYLKGIGIGTLGGIVAGLLPSIGSSQSALIIQNILGRKDEKEFLVAVGGVNTSAAIYALLALYLINNPRSGASIAVEHIAVEFQYLDFLFVIGVILLTAPWGVLVTLKIARVFIKKIQSINYETFSKVVLGFLFLLILLVTGLKGLAIAITGSAIGFVTPILGIRRSYCMAVLIVPTILYFI
jgi:putative membrane protein